MRHLDGLQIAKQERLRDDPGEGKAADRTVQLKAIGVIEGNQGKAGVTVNVNQTNNTATISPGYVIRLRQSTNALPSPSDRDQLTIDASANSPDAVTIEAEAND